MPPIPPSVGATKEVKDSGVSTSKVATNKTDEVDGRKIRVGLYSTIIITRPICTYI